MGKRELTDAERDQIIKLREAGRSWLGIEKELGIPRRIAKRVYEDWKRKQPVRDLDAARTALAAELQREHMESLIAVGRFVVENLCVPQWQHQGITANAFLDVVLGNDILRQKKPWIAVGDNDENRKLEKLIFRENQMLFQCLRQHTSGGVDWKALEDWKKAWNRCTSTESRGVLNDKQMENMLTGMLELEKKGLSRLSKEDTGKNDALEKMVELTLKAIWDNCLDTSEDLQWSSGRIKVKDGSQRTQLTVLSFGRDVVLECLEPGLAHSVKLAWDKGASNFYRDPLRDRLQELRKDVDIIRRSIESLNEQLNPLVLRRLIIRSSCDLCPV